MPRRIYNAPFCALPLLLQSGRWPTVANFSEIPLAEPGEGILWMEGNMTKYRAVVCSLGLLLFTGIVTSPAHAQATRTWVSGVGNDANPCSRTAPCKTWAGAISKTATGGEIDALDPGGFGALTITKSITLDGGGGQVASTLVSGTPGITISAGATDVVIIRNTRFNGLLQSGVPGTIGINVLKAGRVELENDDIFGFGNAAGQGGIVIAPSSGTVNVGVQNTSVYDSQAGLLSKPTGGATVNLIVQHSYIDNNQGGGVRIDGTGGGTTNAAITDTSMSLNNGNGMVAISGPSNVKVDLMRDIIANNVSSGVQSNNSAGGTSTVTVGDSILSNNVVGAWLIAGSATLQTFKNNQVTGPVGSVPTPINFQ
jgi:hypothetical protein